MDLQQEVVTSQEESQIRNESAAFITKFMPLRKITRNLSKNYQSPDRHMNPELSNTKQE
jgi:hypothetical protein